MDDLSKHMDTSVPGEEPPRSERDREGLDAAGGAAGAGAGAIAGGTAGTFILGPIGTIIGAIAGAVGGGWAGFAASSSANYSDEDERYYEEHYTSSPNRPADRGWDDVRPAYQLGHFAGRNPDYSGRRFEDVEGDLRAGWTDDVRARHGEWDHVRPYVSEGYSRSGSRSRSSAADRDVSREAHGRPVENDPLL